MVKAAPNPKSDREIWEPIVDLELAAKNCFIDMLGDWHRDPWAWPEINWVSKNRQDFAFRRLGSPGVKPVALLDVVKENFVVRPAVVLDPLDRLCYQALVDRGSVRLLAGLTGSSYGWRLDRKKPERGQYRNQSLEWDAYRARLVKLATIYPSGLQTDIVSYFASIDVAELVATIYSRLGKNLLSNRLAEMLVGWDKTARRGGLPQRALPSAVLSNLYLIPIDDVLLQFAEREDGGPSSLRWVDDIWIFGHDVGLLRQTQIKLQESLRSLSLNLNAGKTTLLQGDKLMAAARESEHSAVDAALDRDPASEVPLDHLIDRIVAAPEMAARTSIRFATKRMRDNHIFRRTSELMAVAERMPHGADALARLVRDAGVWAEYMDWFVAYTGSHWAPCDWAIAQFGTMFPASTAPPHSAVIRTFATFISPSSAISLLALAAHRLAMWDPAAARGIIRDVAGRVSAGWQRRILALAGLQAGLDRPWVRDLLGDLDENEPTLDFLQEHHFAPVRTAADYQ